MSEYEDFGPAPDPSETSPLSSRGDLQSEESLLGACLLSEHAIGVAEAIVTPDDFYKPAHGHIYEAITYLHGIGEGVDPVTVSAELRRRGLLDAVGGAAAIVVLQTATPATSNAGRYARNVARLADMRRIQVFSSNLALEANGSLSPAEIIEEAIGRLREIGAGRTDALPSNVSTMEEFLARPEEQRPDWIVPGLMRVGWRVILTATEGAGKTYLLRQIAAATAAGIHPFAPGTQIKPRKVLLVDLENPAEHIDNSMAMIQDSCARAPDYDPDNFHLWHSPGGINLRSRSDRAQFDNLLRELDPDLVCLGPIYKSYQLSARETDEIAVREVQNVLDDLRTRHSFGLLMEHHAAKASGGGKRSLDPYGTSFWMRWPEIGIGMEARLDSEEVTMGRWRGDRLPNSWPESVFRSTPWPWAGRFENGLPGGDRPPILSSSAPKLRQPPKSDEF